MLISRNAHSGSIPLRHSEGVTYSLAGTRFSGVGQSAPWGAFCSPELGLHGPRGGACCARVLVASPQKWVALRHPTLDCPASPAEVDESPPRGGPSGGRRGGSNERSKQRIDRSTPEQRAQQSEYRRAIEERRKELGLSPSRRG